MHLADRWGESGYTLEYKRLPSGRSHERRGRFERFYPELSLRFGEDGPTKSHEDEFASLVGELESSFTGHAQLTECFGVTDSELVDATYGVESEGEVLFSKGR